MAGPPDERRGPDAGPARPCLAGGEPATLAARVRLGRLAAPGDGLGGGDRPTDDGSDERRMIERTAAPARMARWAGAASRTQPKRRLYPCIRHPTNNGCG